MSMRSRRGTDEFCHLAGTVLNSSRKPSVDLSLDAIEGAGMLTKAQSGSKAAAAVILRQCEDYLQTGDIVAPLLTPRAQGRPWRESQLR